MQYMQLASAKDLVNMLARAGRLGYSENDLIDDDEDVCPAHIGSYHVDNGMSLQPCFKTIH